MFKNNWHLVSPQLSCPVFCCAVCVFIPQSSPTLLDPWDCIPPGSSVHGMGSPSKNTGVGCPFVLQGIFLTQGLSPGLPHCRETLPTEPPRKPVLFISFKNSSSGDKGLQCSVHTPRSLPCHPCQIRKRHYCRGIGARKHEQILSGPKSPVRSVRKCGVMTSTWLEHATFWSGVRRATIAPRGHESYLTFDPLRLLSPAHPGHFLE